MRSYIHFTLEERENLQLKREAGKSIRQIAREMSRSASSISRELLRNFKKDGGYSAWWACGKYIRRRKRCRKRYRMSEPVLRRYVCTKLSCFWSPEIIAAKWNETHCKKLHHSTIYKAIREQRLEGYTEREYLLRRGRRKYSHPTKSMPVHVEHSIHERPPEANTRSRFGDFEVDTIRGGNGDKGNILTCIDRRSRFLLMALLPNRTAAKTATAVCRMLKGHQVHSLTLDNGGEFSAYSQIEKALDTTVYFADPHAPWQRGSIENINGILRFFFPKGMNLKDVTQEDLDLVADLLNSRPRKCLGWLTPSDFIKQCCT